MTSHDTKESTASAIGSFLFFALIVLLVRSLLISPFRIPSGSMIPTLKVGDFIVTSKYPYGWSRYSFLFGGYVDYFKGKFGFEGFPERGDVMVFAQPNDTRIDYIKRVIGLPGDTIQMVKGRLYINSKEIPLKEVRQEYKDHDGRDAIQGKVYEVSLPRGEKTFQYQILKQEPFGQAPLDNTPLVTVPENHVFCMGDNWDGSGDSRADLGVVSREYFLGPALFIFFSLNHENIYWYKPWTWFMIPLKIRYDRCIFHKI
jgi:signal peptidase I